MLWNLIKLPKNYLRNPSKIKNLKKTKKRKFCKLIYNQISNHNQGASIIRIMIVMVIVMALKILVLALKIVEIKNLVNYYHLAILKKKEV